MTKTILAAAFTAAILIGTTAFGTSAMAQAYLATEGNRLTVTNGANSAITKLNVSYSHVEDDGRNYLNQPIAPGASQVVLVESTDNCRADIIATYANGRSEGFINVNTCASAGRAIGTPWFANGEQEEEE